MFSTRLAKKTKKNTNFLFEDEEPLDEEIVLEEGKDEVTNFPTGPITKRPHRNSETNLDYDFAKNVKEATRESRYDSRHIRRMPLRPGKYEAQRHPPSSG